MTVLLLLLEQEPELCWSRFVKEKGLQAGDVVGFSRSAAGADTKLFIACRLRPNAAAASAGPLVQQPSSPAPVAAKAVRLFGVDLVTEPAAAAAPAEAMAGCKRARELEAPPEAAFKKQLVELTLA